MRVTTLSGSPTFAATLPVRQRPVVSVSMSDTVQFAGRAKAAEPSRLLTIEPAVQSYLAFLKEAMSHYSVADIQHGDETRTPPLSILRNLTRAGKFVTGVPLPDMALAKPLLNQPEIQAALDSKTAARLNTLSTSDETKSLLTGIADAGYAKAVVLSSIEMAKNAGAGITTFLGVSSGLAAETISKIGTEPQQALWLNALNTGVFTYGFGLTEETIGSDPRSIKTTFKEEKDATGKTVYRLSGNKKFIGNAARVLDAQGGVVHPGADFILIYAVDDPNKSPEQRSFRVFMVPRQLIGEENFKPSGGESGKLGMGEVNNGDFTFENVMVPEAFLIGEPGEDIYPKLLKLLDETRLFVGAMSLGQTESVLEKARGYAARRVQNGHKIEEFQAVDFPLQDLEAKAVAARLMLLESAKMADEAFAQKMRGEKPQRFGTETSMAKLFASELAEDAAKQAINTLGGNGFIEDVEKGLGLPKQFRDTKVLTIYEGTSNIQRNVITGGVMITEGKKTHRKIAAGVSQFPITRQLAHRLFLDKRFENKTIERAYQEVLLDVMPRYEEERRKLHQLWITDKKLPDVYKTWEPDSVDRQLRMEALLPIQAQAHILADMATYRRMAQLSADEIKRLKNDPKQTPQHLKLIQQLQLFIYNAENFVSAKLIEFRSPALNHKAAAHGS